MYSRREFYFINFKFIKTVRYTKKDIKELSFYNYYLFSFENERIILRYFGKTFQQTLYPSQNQRRETRSLTRPRKFLILLHLFTSLFHFTLLFVSVRHIPYPPLTTYHRSYFTELCYYIRSFSTPHPSLLRPLFKSNDHNH